MKGNVTDGRLKIDIYFGLKKDLHKEGIT